MAKERVQRPTFFEVFKARCSNADLGPTSINWFQELSSEAPSFENKSSEELQTKNDLFDKSSFKTPKRKTTVYTQLASTPKIFKDQSLRSPPFSSPMKEQDTNVLTTAECTKYSHSVMMKPDFTKEEYSPPLSTVLNESPALIKEMFRTPHRHMKYASQTPQRVKKNEVSGSLFCTPKILMDQTAKCISKSLGAELDPEMSWSSSLATPPSLSATVIIAKGKDHFSGQRTLEDSTDIIVRRLLTKCDNRSRKGDRSSLSQRLKECTALENNSKLPDKDQNIENSCGDTHGCENKMLISTNSLWKQTVPKVLEDGEVRQTVEHVLDGMDDVLSVFFASRKPPGLRKVKTFNRERKKNTEKLCLSIPERDRIYSCVKKDVCLTRLETHFDSSVCNFSVDNLSTIQMQIEAPADTDSQENVPSSSTSQWSQLNLSGLNITQMEAMSSYIPCSSVNLFSMKCREDTFVVKAKESTTGSNLEDSKNIQDLPLVKRELHFNQSESEKKYTNLFKETIQETSPSNDLHRRSRSPTFPNRNLSKDCVTVNPEKNVCLQKKSMENACGVSSLSLNGLLAGNCSITSNHCTQSKMSSCNEETNQGTLLKPTEPQGKAKGVLSSLKKQQSKFIYSIHGSCQNGGKTSVSLNSESSLCVLSHSEANISMSKHDADEGANGLESETCTEKNVNLCFKSTTGPNTVDGVILKNGHYNDKNTEITVEEAGVLVSTAPLAFSQSSSSISEQKRMPKTASRNVSNIKRKVSAAATLFAAKRCKTMENILLLPPKNTALCSNTDSAISCILPLSPKKHCEEASDDEQCSAILASNMCIENCSFNEMHHGENEADENTSNKVKSSIDYIKKQAMLPPSINNQLVNLSLPDQQPKYCSVLPLKQRIYSNVPSSGTVQQLKCDSVSEDKTSKFVFFQTASKKNISVSKGAVQKGCQILHDIESSFLSEVVGAEPILAKAESIMKPDQAVCSAITNSDELNLSPDIFPNEDSYHRDDVTKPNFLSKRSASETSINCLISNSGLETNNSKSTGPHFLPVIFGSTEVHFDGSKSASNRPIQSNENVKIGKMFEETEEQFFTEKKEHCHNVEDLHTPISEEFSDAFKLVSSNLMLAPFKNAGILFSEMETDCIKEAQGQDIEDVFISNSSKAISDHLEQEFKSASTKQNIVSENIVYKDIKENAIAQNAKEDLRKNVDELPSLPDRSHLPYNDIEYNSYKETEVLNNDIPKSAFPLTESEQLCNTGHKKNAENLMDLHVLSDYSKPVLSDPFDGFKTASNKQINISEINIRRGKALLQECEEQCLTRKLHSDENLKHNSGRSLPPYASDPASSMHIQAPEKQLEKDQMLSHKHEQHLSEGNQYENELIVAYKSPGLKKCLSDSTFDEFQALCSQSSNVPKKSINKNKLVKDSEEEHFNWQLDDGDRTRLMLANAKRPSSFSTTKLNRIRVSGSALNKETILFKQTKDQCFAEKNKDVAKDSNRSSIFPPLAFCGFRTASNKQIQVSEIQIEKGKKVFIELEDHFPEGVSKDAVQHNLTQKEQTLITPSFTESIFSTSALYDFEPVETNGLVPMDEEVNSDLKRIVQKLPARKLSMPSQSLTESQKAEITEISNMLEEDYSQFEFTQCRKINNVITKNESASPGNACEDEIAQLNNSDVWKDVNFDDSFDAKAQVANGMQLTEKRQLSKSTDMTCEFIKSAADLEHEPFQKINASFASSSGGTPASIPVSLSTVTKDIVCNVGGFEFVSGKKNHFDNGTMVNAGAFSRGLINIDDRMECSKPVLKIYTSAKNQEVTSNIEPENDAYCVTGSVEGSFSNANSLKENVAQVNLITYVNVVTENENQYCKIADECFSSLGEGLEISTNKHSPKSEIELSSETIYPKCTVKEVVPVQSLESNKVTDFSVVKEESMCFGPLAAVSENTFCGAGGFQTASGRNISVLKNSLVKALPLFDEQCPRITFSADEPSQKEDLEQIESNFLHRKTEPQEANFPDPKDAALTTQPCISELKGIEESMKGFHTASGKKVIITEASLAKVKHIFSEEKTLDDGTEKTLDGTDKPCNSEPADRTDVILNRLTVEKIYPSLCSTSSQKKHTSRKILEIKREDALKLLETSVPGSCYPEVNSLNHKHSRSENAVVVNAEKHTMYPSTSSVLSAGENSKSIHFSETLFLNAEHMFNNCGLEVLSQNSDTLKNISSKKGPITIVEHYAPIETDLDEKGCGTAVEKTVNVIDIASMCCNGVDQKMTHLKGSNWNPVGIEMEKTNSRNASEESPAHSEKIFHAIGSIFPFKIQNENADSNLPNISPLTKKAVDSEHNFEKRPSASDSADPNGRNLKGGPLGFSTASGKIVCVSDDSLKKAKQIFQDTCVIEKSVLPEIETESTVNIMDILEKSWQSSASPDKSVILPNHAHVAENITTRSNMCPLSTAKGKPVCVQEKSLKHVRRKFSENQFDGELPNALFSKGHDKPASKINIVEMPRHFFSTASGKPVQLSEKSLKKAKELFLEIENGNSLTNPKTYSQSNSPFEGDKINAEVKKPIVQDNGFSKDLADSKASFGFNTASGKPVLVSEEALQTARCMLQEFDNLGYNAIGIEEGAFIETRQSCPTKHIIPQTEIGAVKIIDVGFQMPQSQDHEAVQKSLENSDFFKIPKGLPPFSSKLLEPKSSVLDDSERQDCSMETCKGNVMKTENDSLLVNQKCMFLLKSPFRVDETRQVGEGNTMLKQPTSQNNEYSKDLVDSKANFGFSTASGKQVLVSDKALEKVKSMLQECDELDCSDIGLKAQSFSETRQPFQTKNNIPQTEFVAVQSTDLSFQIDESHDDKCITHSLENKMWVESFAKTSGNCQEKEAADSAKAFMEDEEFTDTNLAYVETKSCSNKSGKRLRADDRQSSGEPSIKRQLLPEFDRTVETNGTSLKALRSSPDGTSKDRRKFLYNIPLKPVTCRPPSVVVQGGKDARTPSVTIPNEDLKGFRCKAFIFQNKLLNVNSSDPLMGAAPCDTSASECEKPKNSHATRKSVRTFVPPVRTKSNTSAGNACASPISNSIDNSNADIVNEHLEDKKLTIMGNDVPLEGNQSMKASSAYGDCGVNENINEQGLVEMIENLHCARDMQAMRIRKKQRQRIRPQPGSLYMEKSAALAKVSLKTAVEGKSPSSYSTDQLHMFGVLKCNMSINSENADSFQFDFVDHFTKDLLFAGQGIQIADGGWLIPTDNHKAGKEEFYRALCDTPGVDPKLISVAWVYNHYRWIVWKLAAMEVSFPEKFGSRCLTPERVLLQLKYRYDVEVDKSQRSAVKKIVERDDTSAKTLILCVSKIINMGANPLSPNGDKPSVADSTKGVAVIEVTDGWYGIKALLDPPLTALINRKKLVVGSKIIVHGAELIGSEDACSPLEAPESLMLKISANSTRLARWHSVLGFHRDPRPFSLSLSSLFNDGGIVGCIDVIIQRVYPLQWMEKMPHGLFVFRNDRGEEREAEKHAAKQQKNMEALFTKIQAEFEKSEAKVKTREVRRRTLTRKQIHGLQDGAEIYEAIQCESDPGYLETCLSNEQLRALNSHRQMLNDKKQAEIQAEFRKAIESDEQAQNGCRQRDVTAIWKLLIVDYKSQEKDAAFILNIWRPLSDVHSLLKEGGRYKIYHLSTSHSKGKCDACDVQLTATKKTKYQPLELSQEVLTNVYCPRRAVHFSELLDPSFYTPCAEVDLVGYIISVSRKAGLPPIVYLSDENQNLIAIKFWTDLHMLAIDEVVKPCIPIAGSNLQKRVNSSLSVPTLFAGELSIISANPKDNHLQEAIKKLRNSVQNVKSFCTAAEKKLVNLQQGCSPTAFISPRDHGLNPPTPSQKCDLVAGRKCQTPTLHGRLQKATLSDFTAGLKDSLKTPSTCITPQSSSRDTNETDSRKSSKKRKTLDFLCRIPSPPPVSPAPSMISPFLQKAFRPPRSTVINSKEKDCTTVDAMPLQACTTTPPKSEDGWVADEELAMIDTQALFSEATEEMKVSSFGETSIKPPCGVKVKNNYSQTISDIGDNAVDDMGQEAVDPVEKQIATPIPSGYRRKLQRKKRKCD